MIQRVVGLAHLTNGATDGIGLVDASDNTADWVDLGDVQLDRCVILRADDSVASRALNDTTKKIKINL